MRLKPGLAQTYCQCIIFATYKGPTWRHGHDTEQTSRCGERMRPHSPELSAEAVCTRVCLLREEGPLLLRFSTPKGTELKKGLEPFPLCADELSGFSCKIGTKSSSNIDQPKSEGNGDGQMT